jgi:hypothetical protein
MSFVVSLNMAYPFCGLYRRCSWVFIHLKDTPPFLSWQSTTFDYNSHPITTTTSSVESITALSAEFPFSLTNLPLILVLLLIYGLLFWERNTQRVSSGVSVVVVVVDTRVPLRLKRFPLRSNRCDFGLVISF